jgi:hypothetical protein
MELKTYTRRDSCTAVLRKMGIKAGDYDFFIDKQGDQFMCRTDKATLHLAQLKAQAEGGAAAKPAKAVKQPKEKKVNVSSRARELIHHGKTNEEVWAVLQAEFNLDGKKKHYPGWYRAAMTRAGLLG